MGYQHIKFDAEGLKFEGVLSLRENSNSVTLILSEVETWITM